jgi:hypothetical protein
MGASRKNAKKKAKQRAHAGTRKTQAQMMAETAERNRNAGTQRSSTAR